LFIAFLIDHGSDEGGGQKRRWEKRGTEEKAEVEAGNQHRRRRGVEQEAQEGAEKEPVRE
jgi:hypothetical protein